MKKEILKCTSVRYADFGWCILVNPGVSLTSKCVGCAVYTNSWLLKVNIVQHAPAPYHLLCHHLYDTTKSF